MTDPLTFPDGYYAAADPDNPNVITCWRRSKTKARFDPWQRGARYGPVAQIGREDVPKPRTERDAFIRKAWAEQHDWLQRVYATIAADLDAARLLFAGFTGKCGMCGKPLTDPKSKLLGIGPDCRGER